MNKPPLKTLAQGKYLRLLEENHWEYVERLGNTGIAILIAVTSEGKLLLTEQFRPPVQKTVIELPAGLAGDMPEQADEDILAAARRELLEETGYIAERFCCVTAGPISAGLSNEVLSFVLAENLTRVGPGGGDESEDILVHEVPLSDVHTWLEDKRSKGLLIDPKIYAALYFVKT